MNLKGLAARAPAGGAVPARDMLAGGVPIAVAVEEVIHPEGREIKGRLIVDAFGTKAGTRVTLRDADPSRWHSLSRAVRPPEGPASGPGDILAFSSAFASGGVAMVGDVGARTHDGQLGEVQVMTAMVRVGQSRVSEKRKSASQRVTVADGASAEIARTPADVERILSAAAARPWLGASVGALLRSRDGGTAEFFCEEGAGIDYLLEELEHAGTLARDVIEVVPAWRIDAGRDQVSRDVNPRAQVTGPVSGPVTRQFEHPSLRGQGFQPCLLVTCDEEEWAFGGKTGRILRVAAGVQPLFKRTPLAADSLPSRVRAYGGTPNPVRCLYTAADVAAAVRKPTPAQTAPTGGRHDEGREERAERSGSGLTKADGSPRFPGLARRGPRPA